MIKVLFLHGSNGGRHGPKADRLTAQADFVVAAPEMPFPSGRPATAPEYVAWMTAAVGTLRRARAVAQAAADDFQPDVIVGSSMGGAVATAIDSGAGRVLIAPAWSVVLKGLTFPVPLSHRLSARTVILHAGNDELVPFDGSLRALEAAEKSADPAEAATVAALESSLKAAGYNVYGGRLIRIGDGHRCNHPDPHDERNRNPDPLAAMVEAVRLLASHESP